MIRKVFVTGAPGWLGSRCVELLARKEAVSQGQPYSLKCLVYPGSDEAELKALGVEIIHGSVSAPETLKGSMKGCDALIHMAGIIHPKKVSEFYEVNDQGTQNVLEEASQAGLKRIVFISSNSPAGFSPPGRLLTEEGTPQPYMHYGKSKYRAEQILLKAAKEKRIEAVILRPCWYYGPRQPARQTRFFRMIRKGRPVLFGNGGNLRSISYIDHVVQAIALALEKENVNGEIFWIADEKPYTTLEIYQTIAGLLGVKELRPRRIPAFSSLVFENIDRALQAVGIYQQEIHVAGEMARDIACRVEKAKRILGFSPTVSLQEGMYRSIEWCRENGIEL